MKKTLMIALITLFWVSCANAQPPQDETSMRDGPPRPPTRERHGPENRGPQQGHPSLQLQDLDRLTIQLELEPEQVDAMRGLLFESGKARLTREGKIRVLEFTIRAMMMEEQPSLQELREHHEELVREQAAVGWSRLETELKMKEILSPEQQRKLRTRPPEGRPDGPQRRRAQGERRFPGPPGERQPSPPPSDI
jgi:Spy/CpxP family protein refolding chaperone